MDERESARAEIDDSRERMKEIAAQLARRAKPSYVKQKAKAAAMEKTVELKDRITSSPIALGLIGGLGTAVIARIVLNRREHRDVFPHRGYRDNYLPQYDAPRYGTATQPDWEVSTEPDWEISEGTEGRQSRAREKVEGLKSKAGELKEKAMHRVDNLRERIPSGAEVKTKAKEMTRRAGDYAGEEPVITALGALAVGAALGFLLPLTRRERRVLEPAREQVSEKLQSFGSEMSDKFHEKMDALEEKIAGEGQHPPDPRDVKSDF
jgi:ElaB/YqjD/DUF883 family membrane-anchored ribosome-binding protein